jgi:hypothetical protein
MPTPQEIRQEINKLSQLGHYIHLAMRKTDADVRDTYKELFQQGRAAYTESMQSLAAGVGCQGARVVGQALDSDIQKSLSAELQTHASSIVATYNRDLAIAIRNLLDKNPRANRNYLTKYLLEWDRAREGWKQKQVALVTKNFARNMAVDDFVTFNEFGARPWGEFVGPNDALTCADCRSLLLRNPYKITALAEIPMPRHPNCRHTKQLHVKYLGDCGDLWAGTSDAGRDRTTLSEGEETDAHRFEEWTEPGDWFELFVNHGRFDLEYDDPLE